MGKRKHSSEFFMKVLIDLFKKYKKVMRINKHWSLEVKTNEKKDHFAEVIYSYDKRHFTVFVNSKLNGTVHTLKDTLIHENWHILLAPYTARVDRLIKDLKKGKKVKPDKVKQTLKNEEERLVRKFTQIILNLERKNDELQKQVSILQKKVSK